jgi:hypothetical protein
MQKAQEMAAFAQAFSGLSQSLQQFGQATENKKRRGKAEQKSLEAEMKAQALEASEYIDLQASMTGQEIAWQKGFVPSESFSQFNAPGFPKYLSQARARKAVRESWVKEREEFGKWLKEDPEAMSPNAVTKWYASRTSSFIDTIPDNVGNENMYTATILAERSKQRSSYVAAHEKFLGDFRVAENMEHYKSSVIEIVNGTMPVPDSHPAPDDGSFSADDRTVPSAEEQLTASVKQVENLIQSSLSGPLSKTANRDFGKWLVDAAVDATSVEERDRALDIYERVRTGTNKTGLLKNVSANIIYRDSKNKELTAGDKVLRRKQATAAWDSKASSVRSNFMSMLTSNIDSKMDSQSAIEDLILKAERQQSELSEEDRGGVSLRVDGDVLTYSQDGQVPKKFDIPSLYKIALTNNNRLKVNKAAAADAASGNRASAGWYNPRAYYSTRTAVTENSENDQVVSGTLKLGASIGNVEDAGLDGQQAKDGYLVWKMLGNNEALRNTYAPQGSDTAFFYEALDAIKRTPALERRFSTYKSDEENPGFDWEIFARTFANEQELMSTAQNPKLMVGIQDLIYGAKGAVGTGIMSLADADDISVAARLLRVLTPGATDAEVVAAAMETNESRKVQITTSEGVSKLPRASVNQKILDGTHDTLASASYAHSETGGRLMLESHIDKAVKVLKGSAIEVSMSEHVKDLIDGITELTNGLRANAGLSVTRAVDGGEAFWLNVSWKVGGDTLSSHYPIKLSLQDIAALSEYHQMRHEPRGLNYLEGRGGMPSVNNLILGRKADKLKAAALEKEKRRLKTGLSTTEPGLSPSDAPERWAKNMVETESSSDSLSGWTPLRQGPSREETLLDSTVWEQAPDKALRIRWGLLKDQVKLVTAEERSMWVDHESTLPTLRWFGFGEPTLTPQSKANRAEAIKTIGVRLRRLNNAVAETEGLLLAEDRSVYGETREFPDPSKATGMLPSMYDWFGIGNKPPMKTVIKFDSEFFEGWWKSHKQDYERKRREENNFKPLIGRSGVPVYGVTEYDLKQKAIRDPNEAIMDAIDISTVARRGNWNTGLFDQSDALQNYFRALRWKRFERLADEVEVKR